METVFGTLFENFGRGQWEDLDFKNLHVDEAYMYIVSHCNRSLTLYSLSEECIDCPYTVYMNVEPNSSYVAHVETKNQTKWRIYDIDEGERLKDSSDEQSLMCEVDHHMGEFGVYTLEITENECSFMTHKEPVNIYLPFVVIMILLILLHIFGSCIFSLLKKFYNSKVNGVIDTQGSQKSRIRSVDTFRGIALCVMMVVNDGGGEYWFLKHSTWYGLTVADLLFPWFLWIMGVCIAFSHKPQSKNVASKISTLLNIFRRGMILFILGMSINTVGLGPVRLDHIRILGVLQRIGISYIVVASMATLIGFKYNKKTIPFVSQEIIILWPQWICHLLIVAFYWLIVYHLEVPGCPKGYLGPGGIQKMGEFENCTGGATGYVDYLLVGERHLFEGLLLDVYQENLKFDPENILGFLTSIFHTFLGLIAGCILVNRKNSKERIFHWTAWGISCLLLGIFMDKVCGVPINKYLWTLSFVLVLCGLGFLLLALLHWIVDYRHWWDGSPFIYPGMNSIIMFYGSLVCYELFPWHWKIPHMNTHTILLLESLWGLGVWMAIARWLYHKKFFLSI